MRSWRADIFVHCLYTWPTCGCTYQGNK
ncbi:unnamed protein product [Spirodela intermedia]|uniref:Uncharacterized protein n=2 Tax=Spirodela intermedia TaxID=51605 RepID=A0A7I8KQC5_SPIIN|nr:unnamed protein product [Spirodela intermedia]CAA6663551.1 unnamed protein product [Spirodela intermedia]CAA7400039.1 unnamed protein product [Spirodela intermedia]